MIKFVNVSKCYNGQMEALKDVTLDIPDGEFISIIGQSGAGKSTFLKLIIGEINPDSGEVWVNDVQVNALKPKVIPYLRRRIGTIFQDYKLLPNRTVYDNVALALKAVGEKDELIREKVNAALNRVGLNNKKERFPKELSGGEQQRVSIARALVHDPLIIVADECTGNLDRINTYEIINLLLEINSTGTTVVLATHDQEVVDNIKKRVITIVDGQVHRDQQKGGYLV
jgi:cell division transport system ATP-binding protein